MKKQEPIEIKLVVKNTSLDAQEKTIVILNQEDLAALGVFPMNRVIVKKGAYDITCIVNSSKEFVKRGEIILYREVAKELRANPGDRVLVTPRPELESKKFIHEKINGKELNYEKIKSITDDLLERNLNDLELAALITALKIRGMSKKEVYYFTKAMVETSKRMNFYGKVMDKHSIGGVPGDKTTLLVVPIVAAAGLKIPKTSSRSITSPAGTADRMEVLANVEFSAEEIENIVKKTKGCIVWGGALELAPADDLFIEIEHPLSMDPLLIPSVLAKKKVMGSNFVVIDIPLGHCTKVTSMNNAKELARKFIDVGKKLGITLKILVSYGEQPIGHSIGANAEAKDVLETFATHKSPDLIDKATSLAGELLEMAGKKNGKKLALEIFNSGKAEKKFREIIAAQGGNPDIQPKDIMLGPKRETIRAKKKGFVVAVNNAALVEACKIVGAPENKAACIELYKKIGDTVKKGDPLFTIYSAKTHKINEAMKLINQTRIFEISKKRRAPVKNMVLTVFS